jgi:hypothetical protein
MKWRTVEKIVRSFCFSLRLLRRSDFSDLSCQARIDISISRP